MCPSMLFLIKAMGMLKKLPFIAEQERQLQELLWGGLKVAVLCLGSDLDDVIHSQATPPPSGIVCHAHHPGSILMSLR
jgi:hypothetical protein